MVKEEKLVEDKDTEFIVQKSELIRNPETGEKYVTITITPKMLHYIFGGLGKYKEGFTANTESDNEEREKADKLINEFNKVKDILTEEST